MNIFAHKTREYLKTNIQIDGVDFRLCNKCNKWKKLIENFSYKQSTIFRKKTCNSCIIKKNKKQKSIFNNKSNNENTK